MHVLLIHQAFAALNEAGGTRHAEIAAYLADQGHRVTVIASPVNYLTGKAGPTSRRESEEKHPGAEIRRTYTYTAHHRSFFHRLLAFFSFMISSFITGLGVRQVDLVWGTSPPIFQGVTAWLLARLKGVRFLFEVRDLWPTFAVAVGVLKNPLLIRLSEWLERFLYRRADRLVVNSPGFIEHLKERGARDVRLVPNGADSGMFDPGDTGQAFRARHGLEGCFLAIYAGAHGLSNDLGVLLEAAGQLRNQPQIRIVLVGDGKEKPALIQQATEMGLDNVVFLPPIAKNDMAEALAAADACIAILKPIPQFKTTYPNKVFDYMASGRPVILAIDGVIRQVIDESGAGLFVQPGDAVALARAILTLADDPVAARVMGDNGRRCVEERFNRAELAREMLQLMEEMGKKDGRKNTGR